MTEVRRAVPLLLMGLMTLRAAGSVRETQEEVEFRFSGTQTTRWHATRTSLQRLFRSADHWLPLASETGTRRAWGSDRIVLGLRNGVNSLPANVLFRWGLRPDRRIRSDLWILQASDVWVAARAAHELAEHEDIAIAAPVLRHSAGLQSVLAPRPDDPYFARQWHLENRDPQGIRLGPDTNPRAAWSSTRGGGISIAVADIGFETTHPDLAAAASGQPHFDFVRNQATPSVYGAHGTCVAGLVGAVGDNRIGVTGVAPDARLTSLVIFDSSGSIVDEERLMDMYQYRNDELQVQNHSWGNSDISQLGMSAIESSGVSNAVTRGRSGRGVILVRAASNYRIEGGNANDDASGNDPRSIVVAAVRRDGRAASYSNPGACILVSALSADQDDPFLKTDTLVTTDQTGRSGYNSSGADDLANYAFDSTGFDGTSGATPQISGIAALILATNPNLTYRDVQQILIHASRYYDDSDPAAHPNAAALRVGDNQGFGIPDAGEAVRLGRNWNNRPPLQVVSVPAQVQLEIPDDGLRVIVTGTNGIPRSIRCAPSYGLHPDDPTPDLPMVYVGRATNEIGIDLRGKAPLIERGGAFFKDKIDNAARAGAPFAVLFNNVNGDEIFQPDGTDYVTIPAVLMGETDGRDLVARLEGGEPIRAHLQLDRIEHSFAVTHTLTCEHVGLRVRANHARRGDLRITLVSPSGTRSVMQRLNTDTEPGPDNWTYWSVQHFYEPSAGTWTAAFADEASEIRGTVTELELILQGVPIEDIDADGLDDLWEKHWFGSLEPRLADDPDQDGLSNAREQVLGTDPSRSDRPLALEIGHYDSEKLLRISWPAIDGTGYRLLAGPLPAADAATEIARIPGRFPETDWVLPYDPGTNQFFWLETLPPKP